MIIGHAPAGYIISALLFPRLQSIAGMSRRLFLFAGIAGALAPDIDMLYFHVADHRQHHHHSYFTHFPSFWAVLLLLSVAWFLVAEAKPKPLLALVFSLNGMVHMVLDSLVGDIRWLAPWDQTPFSFATVPALYTPWWLNFLLHWSFLVELAVVLMAVALWRWNARPLVGGACKDTAGTQRAKP
jgi:inner membrane protein